MARDLTGVFFYEKDKTGKEYIGRVTSMRNDGQVNVAEEKRQMIPLRELKKHLRENARVENNMAKANKKVESEMRDMTVELNPNGFVASARIYDDKDPKTNQMRAYFDDDEFQLGEGYTKQMEALLSHLPEDQRERVERTILGMIDQVSEACAQVFTEVMGYANERIDEEIKKGA